MLLKINNLGETMVTIHWQNSHHHVGTIISSNEIVGLKNLFLQTPYRLLYNFHPTNNNTFMYKYGYNLKINLGFQYNKTLSECFIS